MQRRSFWPETLYISEEAKEDALTRRILSRIGDVEVRYLSDSRDPLSQHQDGFNLGKRSLMLTRHRGGWIERCPGTSEHVCCNLWTVNPGEGCPLDCTYCYLQHYLRRNPTLKLFTNTSEMLDSIRREAERDPQRLVRVGTGEVIDSLVWDELTDQSVEFVEFFAGLANATLELKTKTDFVSNLIPLDHRGKTVVSWSVNARSVTANDEAFTASLEQRITAAARVVEAGYRVGFHFDPLIYFEGYQDEYRDTIRQIFSSIRPQDIAWISVSSLRFKPEMRPIMIQRFPNSQLPFAEQFLATDNKLRYPQPLRFELLNFVWRELKSVSATLPIYLCMESSAAWRNVAGIAPHEVKEVFGKRLPVIA